MKATRPDDLEARQPEELEARHTEDIELRGHQRPPSFGTIARELADGMRNLVRSEITLAKVEARETARDLGKHSGMAVGFGVLALLSILPFVAFLVIGLGNLLDGRYWLSALIVSLVMLAVGGGVAYAMVKKIKRDSRGLSLPTFRDSVKDERTTLKGKIGEVSSSATRRAA